MKNRQKSLLDFKKDLTDQGIFFCFSGHISQNILREMVKNLNIKKELAEVNRSTANKILKIVIEQLQNVIHYSADNLADNTPQGLMNAAIIIIGYDNQYYFISCGNRIENKYVDVITNKLIKLQNMSKDEIKRYYIEQRNNLVEQEGSKGAGLGFIEMAKKSTKALEFDFQKIDENFSYFSITSFI